MKLFLLGIDSVFSSVEVVVTTIVDMLPTAPTKAKFVYSRYIVTGFVCLSLFLLTLPNCFNGGIYFYKLMDWYTCLQSLMIIGALEVVAILWIFGAKRLR